jgi:F0F1-type ATP synthase membrane subunit b/b'
MKLQIIHQIFWTLVSFGLFFAVMNHVFKKLRGIINSRKTELENLKAQIGHYESKIQHNKEEAHNIYTIELPKKINKYVNKRIELVLEENAESLNSVVQKNLENPVEFTVDEKSLEEIAGLIKKKKDES